MPKISKVKRINTFGAVPSLSYGELAYNAADNKFYAGNAANVAVLVNAAGSGGGGDGTLTLLLASLFKPTTPTGLTASAGNTQVSLSWTAPTGMLSQTPVTDYDPQYSADSGVSWTSFTHAASTATTSIITGLDNGTPYVFRVAALNALGVGGYTAATSSVTPVSGTPPGTPTSLAVTAGNAQASLTWSAPASSGTAAISDYFVQYSSDSGANWSSFSHTASTATSATVTGLANGTAYVFRVAAVSAIGAGSYTSATSSVTPVAVTPDASFSNVSLLLHGDGTGSTIVDSSATPKTVTAYGSATQSAAQSQWGGKSFAFDGTTNCYLQSAANAAFDFGSSDMTIEFWFRSTQSTAFAALMTREWGSTPYTGGWTIMMNGATGGLTIYWADASTSNVFMSSSATTHRDGQWHHFAWTRSGTTHSMYLDGTRITTTTSSTNFGTGKQLTIGSDQTFSGRYFNGFIDDIRITKGTARYTGTTITVPTAAFPDVGPIGIPTSLSAAQGNTQVSLSWTAPSYDGGSAITDYSVQYSSDGGTNWSSFGHAASTATNSTVTGLTNGTAYVFRVAAVNATAGTGSYTSATSSVTPGTVATDANFSNVSLLLHGDGNLTDNSSYSKTVTTTGTVSTAGTAKFGSASIQLSGAGKVVVPSHSSLTFAGDFTIDFWVQFSSKPSNFICFFGGSSGQTQMFLTTKITGNGLRWGMTDINEYASGDFTWATGTWYYVAVKKTSGAVTLWVDGNNITAALLPTDNRTYTGGMNLFGGLATVSDFNGLIDEFRITNGVARTITLPAAAFPDVGPIGVPTSLTATMGNTQVSLAWTAPTYNGGSAITDYSVQYSTNSGSTWSSFSHTASTATTSTVTGLTNGTAYVFRVAAVNGNGTGTYTSATSSVTPGVATAISYANSYVNGGSSSFEANYTITGTSTKTVKLTGTDDEEHRVWLLVGVSGTLSYTVTASTEDGYDYGRLYKTSSSPSVHSTVGSGVASATALGAAVSGTNSVTGSVAVTAGEYLVLAYWRDGSGGGGTDSVTATLSIA